MSVGCASDRPPSGGAVDLSPLQIRSSEPSHAATGFSGNTIRIVFSHPISGREFLKALLIAPSINNYDVSVRGREAEIHLYDHLDPATTYRVILNRHMRDIRGNKLDKTEIIAFSAGMKVDTGSIDGTVYTGNLTPASDALVLAFRNGGTPNQPDYLVQTAQDGTFRLDNLAEGGYLIAAVSDSNGNLRFDAESEASAVAHKKQISPGAPPLNLRFEPDAGTATRQPATPAEKHGTLTGMCRADAKALTIEARRKSDNASFLTAAVMAGKGTFRYIFKAIPPGTYTVSASVPSRPKENTTPKAWEPGRLNPFRASEPFAIYPDTVKIRPDWVTGDIDFSLTP
jgi:hypothetical protein